MSTRISIADWPESDRLDYMREASAALWVPMDFHDEGLTVAGWIRRRRLEQCRRDLTDPALDARPVAAIAARWGFSSAADFSRSFRAAHGVPPAEYRRSARAVKEPAL